MATICRKCGATLVSGQCNNSLCVESRAVPTIKPTTSSPSRRSYKPVLITGLFGLVFGFFGAADAIGSGNGAQILVGVCIVLICVVVGALIGLGIHFLISQLPNAWREQKRSQKVTLGKVLVGYIIGCLGMAIYHWHRLSNMSPGGNAGQLKGAMIGGLVGSAIGVVILLIGKYAWNKRSNQ